MPEDIKPEVVPEAVVDVHAAMVDAIAQRQEEPDSEATPAAEASPETEPEIQSDDEPEAISAEKLESLKAELETFRSKSSSVAEKEEALKNLAAELKPAAQVRDLLRSPGFRQALEKALTETKDPDFEWGHPDDGTGGVDRLVGKFLDPRVDEMQAKLDALENESQLKAVMDYRGKLDGMFETFQKEYEHVGKDGKTVTSLVTPDLWNRIESEAVAKYKEHLTLDLMEAHAYATLRKLDRNGTSNGNGKNGTTDARKLIEKLAKEPAGSRIVAGPGKRKEIGEPPATTKDPKSLTSDDWRDLISNAIAKDH